MSTTRDRSPPGSCEIGRCAHFGEFTVSHPTRGDLDVCGYHARQINDAFDGVEVAL